MAQGSPQVGDDVHPINRRTTTKKKAKKNRGNNPDLNHFLPINEEIALHTCVVFCLKLPLCFAPLFFFSCGEVNA